MAFGAGDQVLIESKVDTGEVKVPDPGPYGNSVLSDRCQTIGQHLDSDLHLLPRINFFGKSKYFEYYADATVDAYGNRQIHVRAWYDGGHKGPRGRKRFPAKSNR